MTPAFTRLPAVKSGGVRVPRVKLADADVWNRYWKDTLESGHKNYHQDMLDRLSEEVDVRGKRVLQIGGVGPVCAALALRGARVTLLDFSTVAVGAARSAAMQTRFDLVRADAACMPFAEGVYDVVVHQGLLEHFSVPVPLLREQHRTLKEGGWLLVDVPQRYSLYAVRKRIAMRLGRWPYGWETDFSYSKLRSLLQDAGFVPVKAYGRWYYPRAFRRIRYLRRAEDRLRRRLAPQAFWRAYERLWERFENGRLSLYTLMNIGVLARKPGSSACDHPLWEPGHGAVSNNQRAHAGRLGTVTD